MMGRLYNVDLITRDCVEEVDVDLWDDPDLEEAITRVRAAAQGLRDPKLRAETGPYGDDSPRLVVSGRRKLTDHEVRLKNEERGRDQRYRDHMKKFAG